MPLPPHPKAVLIDLAGVLHVGDEAVPGAVSALQRLQASGIALRYLTNTSRTPRATIVGKLRRMGFAIEESEVFTAPMAAVEYLRAHGLAPHWLVHPDIVPELGPSAMQPTAVVLGDAAHFFTFESLNTAFRFVMRGLPLIAVAKNRYFKEPDGLTLDMGAFVIGLEFSSGVTATIVGKPAPDYFNGVLAQLGIAAGEAVMIGDDLTDDIGGAQAVGIAGMLVRTGKFRPQDEHDERVQPAAIVDDFEAAVRALLDD
jgi:HAD superfamily hydrolase (TIGR01458 family)